MALPAPLIPNFSGLLNNYAVGYEQADAMRKRNLLLEAGALAAGGAPTVSPSLTQGSSPAAYQTSSLSSRIRGAESGGRLDAKNPNSSAYGPDQFIASTWLDMIRRHRPDVAAGKSPAELLALRSNSELSAQMTDAYAAENSRALQSAGLPVTDGTQYLSHFAGPAGARSVLSADPSTPVSRLLQPAAVRANPFLANMTAGDLRNWADRKVGGTPAAPGGGLAAASNVLLRGGEINAGLALQDRMRKEQQENEAKASEKQKEMWGYIGDLALTADTPEKWARAISVAKNYGLNVDGLDDFAARDLVLARSGRMKTALDMQSEARKAPAEWEATKYGVFNKRTSELRPYAQGQPTEPDLDAAKFEQSLRKEYTDLSKDYRIIQDGKKRVEAGASLDSGTGDMAIVYGYMKLLDPGSVVREGEFAQAEQNAGLPTQVVNLYNKIVTGERLTPAQRQQFIAAATKLAGAKETEQSRIRQKFEAISRGASIDPGRVMLQFEEPQTPPPGGTSGPAVGTIEDNYRFKGGDAGNPANWEPVR